MKNLLILISIISFIFCNELVIITMGDGSEKYIELIKIDEENIYYNDKVDNKVVIKTISLIEIKDINSYDGRKGYLDFISENIEIKTDFINQAGYKLILAKNEFTLSILFGICSSISILLEKPEAGLIFSICSFIYNYFAIIDIGEAGKELTKVNTNQVDNPSPPE